MTWAEHIAWCKSRAHEYLGKGDIQNAVASMLSDLGKHPETVHAGQSMALVGMMAVTTNDRQLAASFIDGFAP